MPLRIARLNAHQHSILLKSQSVTLGGLLLAVPSTQKATSFPSSGCCSRQEVERPSYPDIQACTTHSWFAGTMLDWKQPPREQPASLCLSEACKHDSQPCPPGGLSMFPSAPAAPEESSFLHKGHREFSSAGESTPWLKKKKNHLVFISSAILYVLITCFSFASPDPAVNIVLKGNFPKDKGKECKNVCAILMHEYFYTYVSVYNSNAWILLPYVKYVQF